MDIARRNGNEEMMALLTFEGVEGSDVEEERHGSGETEEEREIQETENMGASGVEEGASQEKV